MDVPENCRFSEEHEWAREEGDRVVAGISDYAQTELGDVVFVELPEPGSAVTKGQPFGTVESVKAVSDIYAPVDGKVVAVNEQLADSPELVNSAAFGDGWMVAIEPSDKSQLESMMDSARYVQFVAEISK